MDSSQLKKSWLFDTSSNAIIPLESTTTSTPSTVLKQSTTTAAGQFAQVVQIEVDKKKEFFIELWNQDLRQQRISLDKTIDSLPTDTAITGGVVLSGDGRYCLFAAEIKVQVMVQWPSVPLAQWSRSKWSSGTFRPFLIFDYF